LGKPCVVVLLVVVLLSSTFVIGSRVGGGHVAEPTYLPPGRVARAIVQGEYFLVGERTARKSLEHQLMGLGSDRASSGVVSASVERRTLANDGRIS